eukprot:GHVS01062174.1.p1 GENE.GHVS01062174.1~~GHVS01062174.1.p1  ORF type:complete len:125 (+),score=11.49 GHVS01062174.1:373-747(+)
MKTFRMIVLAVLAAIAIEDLAVEAERKFSCRVDADCDGASRCLYDFRFLDGRFDMLRNTLGICDYTLGITRQDVLSADPQSEEIINNVLFVYNFHKKHLYDEKFIPVLEECLADLWKVTHPVGD